MHVVCCQVLELAKKVRDRWGSFNDTEDDESDLPNWGFRNFKKLGKIVLGIAKEELRDLPIRGIEDTIEALGQQRGWDRGQVRSRDLLVSSCSTVFSRFFINYFVFAFLLSLF